MAEHVLQLKFLMLIIIAFTPSFVHSEPTCLESTLTQKQQPLPAAIQPGHNVICTVKRDLVYNLEQLSFYVKADCQNNGASFLGCPCNVCCEPWQICCVHNVTTLISDLKGYNAFYANHFKGLFGNASNGVGQLSE